MSSSFTDLLPKELVTHITAICGQRGVDWFACLPEQIQRLEANWGVKVDTPFSGIEFNFVAPAIRTSGEKVVVKISPPYERVEIFQEAKYLRTRDGNGTIRLLDEDREIKAILLEHAFPGEALFQHFSSKPQACLPPAIDVLQNIRRPPPGNLADVEMLDNWFQRFQRFSETDFPSEKAEQALGIYHRLSVQPGRTFYLHGDFHPGNIVTSDRAPFLAIDPKGIVGHIGYDIAVFLNNLHWWQKAERDVSEFLADAIAQFSAAFEIPEIELREWAYAYMVIGAWWNFEDMPEHYDGSVAMTDIWDV